LFFIFNSNSTSLFHYIDLIYKLLSIYLIVLNSSYMYKSETILFLLYLVTVTLTVTPWSQLVVIDVVFFSNKLCTLFSYHVIFLTWNLSLEYVVIFIAEILILTHNCSFLILVLYCLVPWSIHLKNNVKSSFLRQICMQNQALNIIKKVKID
jgi:hypothetical protein